MTRDIILKQKNINWFTYTLLIIAILGTTWGAFTGIRSGLIYFYLFVGSMGLLTFTLISVNEEDKKTMLNYIKTPFTSSPKVAIGMYYLGWGFIYGLNWIGSLTQSFSTTQFFSSLYSASGLNNVVQQSFQAGALESSNLASWFYGVFVAGTMEELTFAFVLPLVFYTIAIGITKTLFKDKLPFGIDNKIFYVVFAMIGAMLTFGYIHKLNATYVGIMFVIAMMFRLITNMSIYIFGMALAFTMGLHHGNNNIAWIQNNSLGQFIESLFSAYGIIFVIIFVSGLIYILMNYKDIWKDTIGEIRGYKI